MITRGVRFTMGFIYMSIGFLLRKKITLFFALYFILPITGRGQQLYAVKDSVEERVFYLHELEFLVDSTNQLSFHDIAFGPLSNSFEQHASYQNADFISNASYWVRFRLQLKPESQKKWLLEFYDQTIDHLEVYVPQKSGGYKNYMLGDAYAFQQRDFLHKNFEVSVDMFADSTVTYYFRVRSHDFADIRIAFRSVNRFVYYALNEYLLYGTFYGMILIICLYNFLIYLAIREIKNIYYVAYILSVGLYAASLDGVGFQYLWPSYPSFNQYAVGITLYSLILWALIFTRRFLSTLQSWTKPCKA
jgi:two-component system, sensor histidine kinase LadS